MNIHKNYAARLVDFLAHYLELGYWPYDDVERDLMSKALGYALKHALINRSKAAELVKKMELPKPKEKDRLYLTLEEITGIIDMMEESFPKDFEASDEDLKLQKYIEGKIADASDSEDTREQTDS